MRSHLKKDFTSIEKEFKTTALFLDQERLRDGHTWEVLARLRRWGQERVGARQPSWQRHRGKVGIKEEGGLCEPGLGEGRMAWVSTEPEDFWCVRGMRRGRSRT